MIARRALHAAGLAALWLAQGPALAQCALVATPGPAPAWVQGGAAEPGPWLHATGVATAVAGTSPERVREMARTQALAELGQQIQAEVRSRISTELDKVTRDGRSSTSETFRAVSEVLSRLQLRGAQVVAEWTDARECRLWVRVRVSEDEAERARRAATSDAAAAGVAERLAAARDPVRAAVQRQAALAEAQELARLADPALTSGYSPDAFELQRVELQGSLAGLRQREDQYRAAMLRHVQAYARSTQAAAGPERRGAMVQALQALEQALGLSPGGVPGFDLPFQPAERLATLFAEMNAGCLGRQWFERRALAAPAALRAGAAGACEPAQLARERRALALGGRSVQLQCSLTLAGRHSAWPKACAALQAALAADGAVPAGGGSADLVAELRADGQVEERRDADSGRSGWRFRGRVESRVRGADGLEIADAYEGLTGWNPVSAAMAGDLLALAVVERLDKALTAHWDK